LGNENSEKNKQDGIPEDVDVSPEDRLTRLESDISSIKGMLVKLTKGDEIVEEPAMDERMKQDDKKKAEEEKEEDKKKADDEEEESEEDKKKAEDEESEEEKKKGDLPESVNNDQDVKLPQAPAGETDETAPPEAGSEEFLEKTRKVVKSEMKSVLKSMGFTGSSTPRADGYNKDVKKSNGSGEFALDILKQVREGKLDQAGITRKIKDIQKRAKESGLKSVLEGD